MINGSKETAVGVVRKDFKAPGYGRGADPQLEAPGAAVSFVQVTKRGVKVNHSAADVPKLRQQFQAQKWLHLSGFFDADLLELMQRKVEESEFRVVDRSVGVELRPVDCTAYLSAELLLNTPKLFRVIEAITGCERIACFSGRIYRRPPSPDYFNRWHTDMNGEGRMIALSVNLSRSSFRGGATEIRLSSSLEVIARINNTVPGDAIIFLIDDSLHHRVGRVEGNFAKTALAGWFRSKPDPQSLFGKGA